MKGRKKMIMGVSLVITFMFVITMTPISGSTMSGNNTVVDDNMDQGRFDTASWWSGQDHEIYVAYEDYSAGPSNPHINFKVSGDGVDSFGSPQDMLPGPDSDDKQLFPSIDVQDCGNTRNITLAYLDNSPGSNGLEFYVMFTRSDDGGSTWSAPVKVTDDMYGGYPNNRMRDLDLFTDDDGNIFIVWSESRHVRISYSTDMGVSWSEPSTVKEFSNPQNTNYYQKEPTIASDTEYVVIAFTSDIDYKDDVFYTRANISGLDINSSLSFSIPEEITYPQIYPMYRSYHPSLTARSDELHFTWWDFSTDMNGNNNENKGEDRPSIKYTSSENGGLTWKVGSERNIIVNSSVRDGWHSYPDIDVSSGGTVVISWIDTTMGHDNVFVTVSADGGRNWSDAARANDHSPSVSKIDHDVSMDSSGNVNVIWSSQDTPTSDRDLHHSRTIVDQPPEKIQGLRVIYTDEDQAMISWNINIEPDFSSYNIHLSRAENFTPSPSTSIEDITDQSNSSFTFKGLRPDTKYNVIIEVEDLGGFRTSSFPISFKTLPVNKAPFFIKDIPPIHVDEDSTLRNALNMSEWIEEEWVKDDGYMGEDELRFEVEPRKEDPKVRAVFRDRSMEKPHFILDISANTPNWVGEEEFRIIAKDSGKDGGFGTPDDMWNASNWFRVIVDDVNDLPIWTSFQDLNTGWQKVLQAETEKVELSTTLTGCMEDQVYRFSIASSDVDGDFITYTASDDRISIEVDPLSPLTRSIFSFTPGNRDVPVMNFTITSDDGSGGGRNLLLVLPVENVNDAPYFRTIGNVSIREDTGSITLQASEGDLVSFNVSGGDIDDGDQLLLTSNLDRVSISVVTNSSWNVSIQTREGDSQNSPLIFYLNLYDMARDLVTIRVDLHVINTQNPPAWMNGVTPISITFIYDLRDENEKKDVNKLGGADIQAEWNEAVSFKGNAVDIDGDPLLYSWFILDANRTLIATYTGREIEHSFSPSLKNLTSSEKFKIILNVTDGNFPGIETSRQLFVYPDIDNDNDGMIDSLEMRYFDSLDKADPDSDPDEDGIPTGIEIGVDTQINTDPLKKPVTPSSGNTTAPLSRVPAWIPVTASMIMLIILAVLVSMGVIFRYSKIREKREEKDIDNRVREMERRQKEISSLYGIQRAGEAFGPDQSTLDDLKLDLGGQVYHEEGSRSSLGIKSGKVPGAVDDAGSSSEHGPLFEKGAPAPEFGDSLKMEE